jgi:hypothetical protein
MFREMVTFGQPPQPQPNRFADVLEWHPSELALLLEIVWRQRRLADPPAAPGDRRTNPAALRFAPLDGVLDIHQPGIHPDKPVVSPLPWPPGFPQNVPDWPHLIYAYMIENTRAFEIFRRVLVEYLHGERLDTPSPRTQRWLRATEELFFTSPGPFPWNNLTSAVRPNPDANRRGWYYRLYGLDLNHGAEGGGPYPFVKAKSANTDFIPLFERLLAEVWRGITNAQNQIGEKYTDPSAIRSYAAQIRELLLLRRRNGNLSREEFVAVSTMSWFYLTVEADTPVVTDLKAQASSPEERLRKIGERVGLPAHAQSESFFRLATNMSVLLAQIEDNAYDNLSTVELLYMPGSTQLMMRDIITDYSRATNRNIKSALVPSAAGNARRDSNGAGRQPAAAGAGAR